MNCIRWSLVFLSISIVLTLFIWILYAGNIADTLPLSSAVFANRFLSTTSSTQFSVNDSLSSAKTNPTEYDEEEHTDTRDLIKHDVSKHNTTRDREISAGNTDANETGKREIPANQTKPFITVMFKGRLGNQMLQYAALFAVSRQGSVWSPVLVRRGRRFGILLDAFRESLSIPVANFRLQEAEDFREDTDADVTLKRLRDLPRRNVTLQGYFQSHKFFEDVKYDLRKEFTFPPETRRRVFAYFRNVTPAEWRRQRFVRVGIHVRRRSLVSDKRQGMGFIERPPSYFAHAMTYFRRKYGRVQFVVASDDMAWCQENIKGENVVYSPYDAVLDLGILAHSDHVITCIGTYSWWAGWLCNGTTVYYGVMPPKGTYLDAIYANNKWVPPPDDEYNHWIPIS